MDICIVPCWRRPEFLAACLGRIRLALEHEKATADPSSRSIETQDDMLIYVAVDHHQGKPPDQGIREVLSWFHGKLHLQIQEREAHPYRGNSFNMLEAYREALSLIAGRSSLVYMVEEDVMVGLDFFRWHRAVHTAETQRAQKEKAEQFHGTSEPPIPKFGNLFCSAASKLIRPNARRLKFRAVGQEFGGATVGGEEREAPHYSRMVTGRRAIRAANPLVRHQHIGIERPAAPVRTVRQVLPNSDAAYFTSAGDYASIGVAFRPWALERIIAHAVPEYFENHHNYCLSHFPPDRHRYEDFEQDGLIQRVMGESPVIDRRYSAWPYVPRCFHAGFYGAHRQSAWGVPGDLRARAERMWAMLAGPPQRLRDLAGRHADIWPCDLGAREYAEPVRAEHLD